MNEEPTSMIYAHKWEDLGEDRIRRWPSKIGEPRPIEIQISSWVGVSIGASHTMLRVQEEKNSWWCEDRNAWMQLSCDSQASGFSMSADVYSYEQAVDAAICFLRDVMKVSVETHVIHYDHHEYLKTIRNAVFGEPGAEVMGSDKPEYVAVGGE